MTRALDGRVAVVTGASRGIGKGVALDGSERVCDIEGLCPWLSVARAEILGKKVVV